MISEPRDIYYLTGLLPELKTFPYPNLLFLGPGQKSWLVTGAPAGEAAAPLVEQEPHASVISPKQSPVEAMLASGRFAFRYDTFGDEAFWGGALKLHGRDTGGVFSQFEASCQPQIGPPLHIHHREEETFFVIEGECTMHFPDGTSPRRRWN